jgi:hypothetical protein
MFFLKIFLAYTSSGLSNVARAYVGGVDIGYELPPDMIDACSHESIDCPVSAGTQVVYDMALLIEAPIVDVLATIQYEMVNQLGQIVVCFRTDINVLA